MVENRSRIRRGGHRRSKSSLLFLLVVGTTLILASGNNDDIIIFSLTSTSSDYFFNMSNISSHLSDTYPTTKTFHLTATTPLPVACGAAVKHRSSEAEENEKWTLFFSQTMDPGIPSLDHDVEVDVNMLPPPMTNDTTTEEMMRDGNGLTEEEKYVIRFFAFVPFGRGVYLSSTYLVQILSDTVLTMKKLSDGDEGTEAMSSGPCLDVDYGGICGCVPSEDICFQEQTCNVIGPDDVCAAEEENVVDIEAESTSLKMTLKEQNGGNKVAAVFYHVPFSSSSSDKNIDAFDVTNSSNKSLYHGIQRAESISNKPIGILSGLESNSTYGIGVTWITDMLEVQYAMELIVKTKEEEEDLTSSGEECEDDGMTNNNVALLSLGASIKDVSSNFGNGDVTSNWGANNAIDGSSSSQWSTNGDGNDAYIIISLPYPVDVMKVGMWSRTMTMSARIQSYNVLVKDDIVIGTCAVPDATKLYVCEVTPTENVMEIKIDVTTSTGGNVGVRSLEIYGCPSSSSSDTEAPTGNPTDSPMTDVGTREPTGGLDDEQQPTSSSSSLFFLRSSWTVVVVSSILFLAV